MHRDKDWLYEQYIIKKRSTTDIAKEVGVSHKTISRWARKHGIELRDTQTALDLKYGVERKSRMQKAMEYYIKSESLTTRRSKPNLNWKERHR